MRKENVDEKRIARRHVTAHDRRIPFLGGRPDRSFSIGKDDLLNLQIALNTCSSMEEFVEAI